jgi:alkanesulfonate monooxygenase SsuD/methylene tetrahydromethanopterin reductase-like flavin-dependent oxidoreductase (luciferase family)
MVEFGVFILMQQRGYHQSSDLVLRNAVEQTIVADQAGFDTAWFAEHHFSNYSLCPSPLMMVAHCAGLTKRIRLGSAVCVLPLYHPARLLAEAGFADTVSNGRLDFGVGAGYQDFEFERFGVKLSDAPAIFSEFLDVLQRGMSEQVFTYEGKHLKFPPTAIAMRTTQTPHPPLWLATLNPETQARAMREGHHLFVTVLLNGKDKLQTLRDNLVRVADAEQHDLAKTKVALLRCAFASDSKSEIDSYLDCARYQRRVSESLRDRRAQSGDGYMIREDARPSDPTLDDLRATLPVGSVDEVIERMVAEIRILRPTHVALQTQLGDFDQATMLKQLDLWGSRIIPAIRRELGQDIIPHRPRALATAS